MKPLSAFLSTVTLFACSIACGETADKVYTGGRIYTVNETQPWAEAIAVKGDSIAFVGTASDAKRFMGPGTKVEDLGGKFVMPGIISTHEHSIFFMAVKSGLVFKEVSHDKDKMLAEVKAHDDRIKLTVNDSRWRCLCKG